MDSRLSDESAETPSGAGVPAGLWTAAIAVRALAAAADEPQLDRMLLALAVHPDGAGFDRAHLLIWDPRAERLQIRGRAVAAAPGEAMELAAALERARAGDGPAEGQRLGDERGIAPAVLDGPAAAAWCRGESAVGAVDGAPAPWREGAQVGAAPLGAGGRRVGLLVGEWRIAGDGGERRSAVEALAAIADEARRAHAQGRAARRTARTSAALAELAAALVSPRNVAELLHLAARLAAQATGAKGSAVWLTDGAAGGAEARVLRLEVTYGPAAQRERLGRALQPVAAKVAASGKPRSVARAADEILLPPEAAAAVTAFVVLPLAAYGRTLGVLAVYDPAGGDGGESAGFDAAATAFLEALTDLASLALDHAGRFHEVRQHEQRNQELAARLARVERLSAVGEIAARTVHEARQPLASIRAFARRAGQTLSDEDPRREYLEIVLRETDRLERVLGEPLDYAGSAPPSLRLESMNEVVQEALQRGGESLVRRRVRLLKKLAPDLPPLLLDGERMRHVLGRILESAVEAVALGGRIRVETRRAAKHAVVEVAHDGARGPGESLEELFVPFANGQAGEPGLGLAVAQRIVREHGGEIRVRAEGEWSTIVAFTVPIVDNQDRRRRPAERRSGRPDRRSRFPSA